MPFLVGNHFHFAAFHDGDDRIGGAKIDADDFFFCHAVFPFMPGIYAPGNDNEFQGA